MKRIGIMSESRKYIVAATAAFTLAGCAQLQLATDAAVSADARLRDKCAYLNDGVAIARLFVGVVPSASGIVEKGAALAATYCSGRPITDLSSAMAAMERIIVAVRPLASQAGK